MEFANMTEPQQNHWYVQQALRTVEQALETNDPTQYRMALLTLKDYLWYLERVGDDLE